MAVASAMRGLSAKLAASACVTASKLRRGNRAEDEPDRRRLIAREHLPGVDELPRPLNAHASREANARTASGDRPGAEVTVAELRVGCRHDDVAGQCELEACPYGEPADPGDHGNVERLEREARGREAGEDVLEVLRIRVAALEEVVVEAAREGVALTADHEHTERPVRLHVAEHIADVVERLLGQAVALVGPREYRVRDLPGNREVKRSVARRVCHAKVPTGRWQAPVECLVGHLRCGRPRAPTRAGRTVDPHPLGPRSRRQPRKHGYDQGALGGADTLAE